MDRLTKLEALTGAAPLTDQDDAAETTWHAPNVKANNVYEGTDSSDDEVIMMRGRITGNANKAKAEVFAFRGNSNSVDASVSFKFSLVQGQLAPEGVRFMSFKTLLKYPYMFVGQGNRQRVAEGFFDTNQSYGHTFDLFYIYPSETGFINQPIILIPSKQFEAFLLAINAKLKTKLTIPNGPAGDAFYVGFMRDGNPEARYLGKTSSKETFDFLKSNVPPYYHRTEGEATGAGIPDERSRASFKEKVTLLMANERGKKATSKQKKVENRIHRQEVLGSSIKRVQRYIGIREFRDLTTAIQERVLRASGSDWYDMKGVTAIVTKEDVAKNGPATFFHTEKPMKFKPEDSVIFISIDVEADEFNHKLITEIGVATLDTLDLVKLAPGDVGKNWMQHIRARHFRIFENRHIVNKVHVAGCPDGFEFGESEFIRLDDAPSVIASCFRHPFSGKPATLTDDNMPKRNIVLVGHAIGADITFLKDMGYDVTNLSNLKDTIDTGDMWMYLKKAANPANLGAVLQDLGIIGWNLHNAGNDAVYTLQVMIGLAIKQVVEKGKSSLVLPKERFAGLTPQDGTNGMEKVQGWSDGEEQAAASDPPPSQAPQQHRQQGPPGQQGQHQQHPGTLPVDDPFGPNICRYERRADPVPSVPTIKISDYVEYPYEPVEYKNTATQADDEPTIPKVDTSSPGVATTQHEGIKENVEPTKTEEVQVMTEQEAVHCMLSAPWGKESDVIDMLAKIKLAPGP